MYVILIIILIISICHIINNNNNSNNNNNNNNMLKVNSRRSDVFLVNFEHISHLVLVFLLLTWSR